VNTVKLNQAVSLVYNGDKVAFIVLSRAYRNKKTGEPQADLSIVPVGTAKEAAAWAEADQLRIKELSAAKAAAPAASDDVA